MLVRSAALRHLNDAPRQYLLHSSGVSGPDAFAPRLPKTSQASSKAAASTVIASGSNAGSGQATLRLLAIPLLRYYEREALGSEGIHRGCSFIIAPNQSVSA